MAKSKSTYSVMTDTNRLIGRYATKKLADKALDAHIDKIGLPSEAKVVRVTENGEIMEGNKEATANTKYGHPFDIQSNGRNLVKDGAEWEREEKEEQE